MLLMLWSFRVRRKGSRPDRPERKSSGNSFGNFVKKFFWGGFWTRVTLTRAASPEDCEPQKTSACKVEAAESHSLISANDLENHSVQIKYFYHII